MTHELQSAPIPERFDHLLAVIGSQRFLRMEGIGKEVPFFVVPYCATEHIDIEKIRAQLINKLKHKGIRVLEVNLYDVTKELMEEQGDWVHWVKHESDTPKEAFLEALENLTDAETKLAPAIASTMNSTEFDVMFLSGVGEVFPYIRSHTVLNNLQRIAKSKPTAMFFPGNYSHSLEDGASLDLFGRLHDDKYYRAFNLYEREA
ncbi:MAG: DUF1788 domain-containing protein [Pirellulaceae bacterium]|nr:DUF1788 domain-containing protein [Pirellulaceae bacterium]